MTPPSKALLTAIGLRYGSNRAQNILANLNTRYLVVKVNSSRPRPSNHGSASSPGLMMAASGGYRVKGKKGGPIKLTQMTVAQLKNMGAKYGVSFTAQNKTKKQILNKIYKAKQGGVVNLSGGAGFVSSRRRSSGSNGPVNLLAGPGFASSRSRSSSSSNGSVNNVLNTLIANAVKPAGGGRGKPQRLAGILNQAASLGLMRNHYPASKGLGYRAMGKKGGPVKMNKLTVAELKAYGAKYGITFNSKNTKKQIIAKIHAKKFPRSGSSNGSNNSANSVSLIPGGGRFASNRSGRNSRAAANILSTLAGPGFVSNRKSTTSNNREAANALRMLSGGSGFVSNRSGSHKKSNNAANALGILSGGSGFVSNRSGSHKKSNNAGNVASLLPGAGFASSRKSGSSHNSAANMNAALANLKFSSGSSNVLGGGASS